MNSYKITHKFGTFEYNPKTQGHKIKWFEIGEIITQTVYNRLSPGTQRHCEKITKSRKKRANK